MNSEGLERNLPNERMASLLFVVQVSVAAESSQRDVSLVQTRSVFLNKHTILRDFALYESLQMGVKSAKRSGPSDRKLTEGRQMTHVGLICSKKMCFS